MLPNGVHHGLAGLEEHFDVPTLAVDPQDFLGGQSGIRADEGDPVLAIVAVSNADAQRRDDVSFPVCQRHVEGQQMLGASAPLLARRKNLLGVHPPAVQLVEYLGALLDHGDGIQLAFPADTEDGFRRSKPSATAHIWPDDQSEARFSAFPP